MYLNLYTLYTEHTIHYYRILSNKQLFSDYKAFLVVYIIIIIENITNKEYK